MAHECGKAAMRRAHDPAFGCHYFVGNGLDVGGGYDPLSNYRHLFPLMGEVRNWDMDDGDAQDLAGVPDDSFDFVHSSHSLEHMRNPFSALGRWLDVTKPGGYVVVLVPDEDLYEQGVWPSTFNGDHKRSFTICKLVPEHRLSEATVNVTRLVDEFAGVAECKRIVQLHASFREDWPRADQTRTPVGECAIEFVLRKRPVALADVSR